MVVLGSAWPRGNSARATIAAEAKNLMPPHADLVTTTLPTRQSERCVALSLALGATIGQTAEV